MKIARSELAAILSQAATVAATSGLDVAQCAVMESTVGKLFVRATDFNSWITLSADCEGELSMVAVNAKRALDVVSSMRVEELTLDVHEDRLRIKGGGTRNLATLPANSLPQPPALEAVVSITIERDKFKAAMDFCSPHSHPEPKTHAPLTGVLLASVPAGLRAVAMDGNSLAYFDMPSDAVDISANLAPAFFNGVIRAAPEGCQLRLSFTDRAALAEWEGGSFRAPMIEGQFFDYTRVLRSASAHSLAVRADEMVDAVKSVSSLAEEDRGSRSSGIILNAGEMPTLEARSNRGDGLEPLDAQWTGIDGYRIGMASSRIAKCLKGFGQAEMEIGFNEPNESMTIQAVGDDSRFAMLFPMRI